MPLNGPIQADGQELKAAHTQKPLGSREGSRPGVCPREGKGGHPSTKSSVKTPLRFQWHLLGAQCAAAAAEAGATWGQLRGLEAARKIQQTVNTQDTLSIHSKMGLWARGEAGRLRVPVLYIG